MITAIKVIAGFAAGLIFILGVAWLLLPPWARPKRKKKAS